MLYFLVLFPYVFSFHSPPVFLSVSLCLSFPRLLCSLLLVPLFSYLLSLSAFWLLSPPQLVLPLFSHLISHLPCFSLVQCPIVFIQPKRFSLASGVFQLVLLYLFKICPFLFFFFFLSSSFCISLQSAQFAFCLSPQLNYTLLLDMIFCCPSASRFHVSLGMLVCKPWL